MQEFQRELNLKTVMSQHTSESNCVFITIPLSVITDHLIFMEYLYVLIRDAPK